ncbi:hypothetical protein [Paludisphaera mucosa]|uniref:Uncharacterized protein n=1 Tax=Paludisphaera mucosa TaxID=3030827 RepID=A0ABT6FK50_9BACT|nr:hypothetical protein [Paludisphaera mucosa]MDG3007871.1 hypothetical protein [Paludisphaera mucosa]
MYRTIRTAGLLLMALSTLAPTTDAEEKAATVEGAWRQVEQKNGGAPSYERPPSGTVMTDYIVGGRFVWIIVRDGKAVSLAGGRYKVEKDKFTEIVEYANGGEAVDSFVGKSFEFTVKIEGDTLTKIGTIQVNGQDYEIDEKWERCKP